MFSLSVSSQLVVFLLFFSLIGCGKKKKEDNGKKTRNKQSAKKPKKPIENRRAKTAGKKRSAHPPVKHPGKISIQQSKKPENKNEAKNRKSEDSSEKSDVQSNKESRLQNPPSNSLNVQQVEAKVEKQISKKSEEPKPRNIPLNKKELEISKGKKRKKTAYPTMDDVKSDWKSEDEEEKLPSKDQNVKPRVIPLDAKGKLIAKGQKRGKNEYPTMDDVKSDWKSESEEPKSNNKNSSKKKTNKEQQNEKKADKEELPPKNEELSKQDEPSKQDDTKSTVPVVVVAPDIKIPAREPTPLLPNAESVAPVAKKATTAEKKKSSGSKKDDAVPDEVNISEKDPAEHNN